MSVTDMPFLQSQQWDFSALIEETKYGWQGLLYITSGFLQKLTHSGTYLIGLRAQ